MFLERFRDMIFAVLKGTGQPLEVLIDLKNAFKPTQTLLQVMSLKRILVQL